MFGLTEKLKKVRDFSTKIFHNVKNGIEVSQSARHAQTVSTLSMLQLSMRSSIKVTDDITLSINVHDKKEREFSREICNFITQKSKDVNNRSTWVHEILGIWPADTLTVSDWLKMFLDAHPQYQLSKIDALPYSKNCQKYLDFSQKTQYSLPQFAA